MGSYCLIGLIYFVEVECVKFVFLKGGNIIGIDLSYLWRVVDYLFECMNEMLNFKRINLIYDG